MGAVIFAPRVWTSFSCSFSSRRRQCTGAGGVLFTSCPIASVTRRQTAAPALSPFAGKLRRPYRTLRLSLIAVVLKHQVGGAPDVDLRDHARRLSNEPLFTVNAPVVGGGSAPCDDFQIAQRTPHRLCRAVARGGS
jgi:hypothetical protein